MEDNVLNPVSEAERVSGWSLLANTAGVGTTLAMLLIGGTSSYMVGVGWTMVAAVISATFGSVIGTGVGRVAQSTGMSSTVSTRFHGLGARGSALASLIFAWMILSFLALENALLYNGTLFLLGWQPTMLNAIVIYSVLTVAWILLALFGLKLIQISSLWLTIIASALLIAILFIAVNRSTQPLGEIMTQRPEGFGPGAFLAVLAGMIGFAGALALTGADFARYARNKKDVAIMAIGGNIIVNFGVVSLGALLYQAGDTVVAQYLSDNPALAESQMGDSIADKVQFLAHNNAGAYFVILAGIIGFIVMYAAQVKAQAINAYAGSLTLSNLFDALFQKTPSRIVMLIIGNVIALVAVYAGILGLLVQFLAALGIATFALCSLVVTDYFIVRKGQPASTRRVELFNWAGIIALLVGFAISYSLQVTGILPIGFLLTLVITPLVYVILRRTVLPEGRGTRMVAGTSALHEAEEDDEGRLAFTELEDERPHHHNLDA
ncbi:cytosine permease [Tessaracoccus sp. MC1756]|nr:cytosine permease [Tessaracoccus sp. MC1756]MBB1508414.1 cytosine permease [Tessaracoccus sp. MC1756]